MCRGLAQMQDATCSEVNLLSKIPMKKKLDIAHRNPQLYNAFRNFGVEFS